MTVSIADLVAALPGENPSGVSLRYEPIYDQIKVARHEDDDLPQGDWQTKRKVADWPAVKKLTTEALSKRTKDLQLAAWLAEALLRTEGFAGLQQGLALARELLLQHWDTVYPELDEGDAEMRAAPLEWIGVKFDIAVQQVPLSEEGHSFIDYRVARTVPTKEEAESDSNKSAAREQAILDGKITVEDFERGFRATAKAWYRQLIADMDALMQEVSDLDQVCTEKFGKTAPSFSPLRNALQEVRQLAVQLLTRKLEMDPDPIDPLGATVGEGGMGVVGGAAASGGPMVSVAAGPRSADEAAAWIGAAARQIRHERPTEPTAYLLLRGFRWGELRTPDRRVDPRLLVAPSTDVRTRLKSMLIDANWVDLLNSAEDVLAAPQGRGWLDLQRYALTAVEGLGSDYEAVGAAIRESLRSLLRDLPSLTDQTLMDDSPVANPETMGWLRDAKLLPEGVDTTEIPELRRTPSTLGRDAYDVAVARARAGDPRGAMDLLMRESAREKSTRARFMRRAQAAEIMVGAGMSEVAFPILRELVEQIDSFRLEEWESGDTVAQPLGLLYRCAVSLGSDGIDAGALYDRVCRLDPVRAIQIKSGGGGDEGS
jgi:type VI secretion system protein ImpA